MRETAAPAAGEKACRLRGKRHTPFGNRAMPAQTCITPLFVPANRPERFGKAAASGADAVIIDLEDAVAMADKESARLLLNNADIPAGSIVRINAARTIWYEDDISIIGRHAGISGVLLPKAGDMSDIAALKAAIPNGIEIILLIETAAGLASVRELARAEGVSRLAFGTIDFCADLGCAHTREALLAARCEIVLASRLAGLPAPLDGVTAAIDQPGLIEAEARHARELGFGGKLCIHPRQIEPTLRGFGPTEEEVMRARRILAAESGDAILVDGEMVDQPVRLRAEQILSAVERLKRSGAS